MKQWQGLLKKEWVALKGWIFGLFGISIFFILLLPFILSIFFGEFGRGIEMTLSMLPFWLFFSLLAPSIILWTSLGNEMMHPDLWLHSPVSIYKLFGAKAFVSTIASAGLLAVSSLVLFMQLTFINESSSLVLDMHFIQHATLFSIAMFFLSIILMCMSLFFRVIYLLMKPYTKKLTGILTLILFFLTTSLLNKITQSELYMKLSSFGAIGNPSEQRLYLNEEQGAFLSYDGTIFYVGTMVFHSAFIVLLFIAAAVLFERKVRL